MTHSKELFLLLFYNFFLPFGYNSVFYILVKSLRVKSLQAKKQGKRPGAVTWRGTCKTLWAVKLILHSWKLPGYELKTPRTPLCRQHDCVSSSTPSLDLQLSLKKGKCVSHSLFVLFCSFILSSGHFCSVLFSTSGEKRVAVWSNFYLILTLELHTFS